MAASSVKVPEIKLKKDMEMEKINYLQSNIYV